MTPLASQPHHIARCHHLYRHNVSITRSPLSMPNPCIMPVMPLASSLPSYEELLSPNEHACAPPALSHNARMPLSSRTTRAKASAALWPVMQQADLPPRCSGGLCPPRRPLIAAIFLLPPSDFCHYQLFNFLPVFFSFSLARPFVFPL